MKTYDVNVKEFVPLISPAALKKELPITENAARTVISGRETIQDIIMKKDRRLVVIAGPCSIHDEKAAIEYAEKLNQLKEQVKASFYLVMRVYFEKPRTNVGWKGLINDPGLDGSCNMMEGLRIARKMLINITEMGLPTATEMLDPITPQYIAGLISWSAIGARTTESQTHREMASGLSMPVGFKNCTDGGLDTALNAMIAAGSPQNFLGIDPNGQTSIVKTTGNPFTHIVLRGGRRPNYDSVSVREASHLLNKRGLPKSIIVDCSHANSHKKYEEQNIVWQDVINQRINGNDDIIGLMLESHLKEGQQPFNTKLNALEFGVSITDACISWETTEKMILAAHEQIAKHSMRVSA